MSPSSKELKAMEREQLEKRKERIKQLQSEIKHLKNNLRFSINIVTHKLNKIELKPYSKVRKKLKKRNAYALSEFEALINEVSDEISTNITVPFAVEDNQTGDIYFFEGIIIEPNKNKRITDYIKSELDQFIIVPNTDKLFIDMNRQFSEETNILAKTAELERVNKGEDYQD